MKDIWQGSFLFFKPFKSEITLKKKLKGKKVRSRRQMNLYPFTTHLLDAPGSPALTLEEQQLMGSCKTTQC